jgi:hypothetical protein
VKLREKFFELVLEVRRTEIFNHQFPIAIGTILNIQGSLSLIYETLFATGGNNNLASTKYDSVIGVSKCLRELI